MTRPMLSADAAFCALWEGEMTSDEIAAHYGHPITGAVVRDTARRAGLPPRVKRARWDRVVMRAKWDLGFRPAEIAAQMGCTEAVVRGIASKQDWPKQGRAVRISDLDPATVVPLWFSNRDTAALAQALGIKPVSVKVVKGHFKFPARYGFTAARDLDNRRAAWERERATENELDVPVSATVPRLVSGHPFWTPDRDLAVVETGGRYVEIAKVADRLGKPIEAVQARWHLVAA